MARTQFFKNIEEWREKTGRNVRTGIKLKRNGQIPERSVDDPIDLHILAIACKVAASQCKRGDLWAEYRRMQAKIEKWRENGLRILDVVEE